MPHQKSFIKRGKNWYTAQWSHTLITFLGCLEFHFEFLAAPKHNDDALNSAKSDLALDVLHFRLTNYPKKPPDAIRFLQSCAYFPL